MYLAIPEKFKIYNQKAIAEIVGVTQPTICRIVNGKQGCSKRTAYCIVKAINEKAKIEDYFTKRGE